MRKYNCLLGSKMLKMQNCRDEDWLTFVDTSPSELTEKGQRSIPFTNYVIDCFVSNKNVTGDASKALFLYQISSEFHNDAAYPFSFNIMDYKDIWAECLKSYMNLERVEESAKKSEVLPKKFYHILYQYNMIIEDTHWISDEARVNVQKIHDLEMPSSYFYELKGLINSL